MGCRARGIYALIIVTATVLFAPAQAGAVPCFGAPDDYVAQHGGDFGEPRDFSESQAWWLEGAGDVTVSIADAKRASHLHYGGCFPHMETWAETGGQFKLPLKLQMHQFVGGHAKNVGGLGFEDGGAVKVAFSPLWAPSSADETRFATLTRASSSVKVCGRRETRGHLEGISPNGGERMFNSFGWQSLVPCSAGRSKGDQRGPGIIFRGWYVGGDYSNVTFDDDFRGEVGFRSSQMDDPVPATFRVKISLGAGANKWLVAVDPNIHAGDFSAPNLEYRGTGTSATVSIPTTGLSAGVHRLMAVGCERLGTSSANPQGGQNCGVGVIPFQVGASSTLEALSPAPLAPTTSTLEENPCADSYDDMWNGWFWRLGPYAEAKLYRYRIKQATIPAAYPVASVVSRLTAGVAAWEFLRNDCGFVRPTQWYMDASYTANQTGNANITSNGSTTLACGTRDTYNVLAFKNLPSNVIAATCTWRNSNGVALESDQVYNTDFAFDVTNDPACSGKINLESVATHESGHTFGLGHANPFDEHPNLTMAPFARFCDQGPQTLGLGDRDNIVNIYAVD